MQYCWRWNWTEVIEEGLKVLSAIEKKYKLKFDVKKYHFGGEAIDKYGVPYPEETKMRVFPVMLYFWEQWEAPNGITLREIKGQKQGF